MTQPRIEAVSRQCVIRGDASSGKPDAGNPHVQFEEGGGNGTQAVPPLLYHVGQIPWETEAKCRLPGSTWRELMQRYYPDCIWTALPQPIVDGLREYQRRFRLPSLERALEELLASQNIPMSEGSAP